jgi:hypothetical protein
MVTKTKFELLEYSECVERLPYTGPLIQIRKFMEGKREGGRIHCHTIAKLNSDVIPDIKRVAGDYIAEDGTRSDHGFNYDPKRRLYVDSSGDQFGESKIAVYTLPCKELEVSPGRTFLERYVYNMINLLTGEDILLRYEFLQSQRQDSN